MVVQGPQRSCNARSSFLCGFVPHGRLAPAGLGLRGGEGSGLLQKGDREEQGGGSPGERSLCAASEQNTLQKSPQRGIAEERPPTISVTSPVCLRACIPHTSMPQGAGQETL